MLKKLLWEGEEHQENSLNANKTSWKISLLSNEDASSVVTVIYCCYCLRERCFHEINFHFFQRAVKRSEMEIFNLFMRRFLTIKFNDDVINKSKKHSLIPMKSLLFIFSCLDHNSDVDICMKRFENEKLSKAKT